jgi:hypothetical protein
VRSSRTRALYVTTDATDALSPWPNRLYASPFPQRWNGLLTYATNSALAVSAGTGVFGAENVFRLNSLFDPDYTFAGHQPYGFDTLTSVYNSYLVTACTVDMTFTDPTIDGLVVCAVAQPSLGSQYLAGVDPPRALEWPVTARAFLNNTGEQKVRFKRRFVMHELEGISKIQYDCSLASYGALYTANPTLAPWLRVAVASLDAAASGQCRFSVALTYEVQMYQRAQTLAQS